MSEDPFKKWMTPGNEVAWDAEALEQLLYVCKAVMPHKEAEKVIAVCLIKAGLETFASQIQVVDIKVDRDRDEPWDATSVRFTVDGIPMKLEVTLDEH